MGFFSWKTSDTRESIPARGSGRETFEVHMITEDGRVFTEPKYEGYGVFGGKDIYELIAELNGKAGRSEGVELTFQDNPSGDFAIAAAKGLKLPKLVRRLSKWSEAPYPEGCEYQGWFYTEDEDDEAASGY